MLKQIFDAIINRKRTAPAPRAVPAPRITAPPSRPAAKAEDKAKAQAARDAAMAQIDDPTKLLEIIDQDAAAGTAPNTGNHAARANRAAALARLAELAAAGRLGDVLQHRPALTMQLLTASQNASYAEQLLASVSNLADLIQVATTAQMPRVRQLAAARITTEADLSELERRSRGQDKTVHRIAKTRLEEQRKRNADIAAHAAELERLRDRILALRKAEHDPMLAARLDHLRRSYVAWCTRRDELPARDAEGATQSWESADLEAALSTADIAVAAQAVLQAHAATRPHHLADDGTVASNDPNQTNIATAPAAEAAPASGATPAGVVAAGVIAAANVTGSAHEATSTDGVSDDEHPLALADLIAVHADVTADVAQLLDRIALVPPALDIIQRRWSGASARRPPSATDAQRYHSLFGLLQSGVDAARRYERAAATFAEFASTPLPELIAPEEPDQCKRLSAEQRTQRKLVRSGRELLAHVHWPTDLQAPPALHFLQADIEVRAAYEAHCATHWQSLTKQFDSTLDQLEAAIEAGAYRAANGHLGNARRLQRCLPGQHIGRGASVRGSAHDPEIAPTRFSALAARVQDMRDWQDFATHPKREALCTSMESLVEEQLDPESRADRIKALRAAWQDLGPLTSAGERALFERFNDAAAKAFEPSRLYFEEQAQIRAENFKSRERVCTTLEQYVATTDWTKADWKLAQQVLHVAREEFLSYSPVDRGPGRDLGKRFDAAAEQLHGLIKGEWDRNVAAKERIVGEAALLLASTDPLPARMDRVKTLQREWRAVGNTPRGVDQRLWKTFRAHCDAVFAVREEERQAVERVTQSDAATAENLCESLETRTGSEEPITDQGELNAIRGQLENLTLSGDVERRLQRRFRDAEQGYLQRLRDHQHAQRRTDFLAILRVHDALARLEQAGAAPDEEAVAQAIAEAGDVDLAARLDALHDLNGEHVDEVAEAAARLARRRWTIHAEVLAGVESPQEDQSVRLELQVNRLAEGLGRRGGERMELPAVLNAWVAAGADLGDEETVQWRTRLEQAIDIYLG